MSAASETLLGQEYDPTAEWQKLARARRVASPYILQLFDLFPSSIRANVPPFQLLRSVDPTQLVTVPELKASMYGLYDPSPERTYMLLDGAESVAKALGTYGPELANVVPGLLDTKPGLAQALRGEDAALLWQHIHILGHRALQTFPEDPSMQWQTVEMQLASMAPK